MTRVRVSPYPREARHGFSRIPVMSGVRHAPADIARREGGVQRMARTFARTLGESGAGKGV